MKFSEKIIELRKINGLSQEDLANKINVTRQTISKWELEQTVPDMNKLSELSKIFNVSIDELINDKDTKKIIQNKKLEENKKNSIVIFIAGLIISFIFLIIGYINNVNVNNTNNRRYQDAYNLNLENNKKIKEINLELEKLNINKKEVKDKLENVDFNKPGWSQRRYDLNLELKEISSKCLLLESEKESLASKVNEVSYDLVDDIKYKIFYYISLILFSIFSFISIVYFFISEKSKSKNSN